MSAQARREFETKYTAEQNYKRLMQIYCSATSVSKGRVVCATVRPKNNAFNGQPTS
jgi:hypothetical protein